MNFSSTMLRSSQNIKQEHLWIFYEHVKHLVLRLQRDFSWNMDRDKSELTGFLLQATTIAPSIEFIVINEERVAYSYIQPKWQARFNELSSDVKHSTVNTYVQNLYGLAIARITVARIGK
ncbi:hypothetical protein PENTCL1PPCAC_7844 [Pristionchus entomophagus]|uniref:Uncharacterized protein n=1 Tax=Pristionchus entomophagus TaxID=358040 RepID=A0AAV5SS37_9BILA|nr:hypothetical protein PENTCL1PPCAC_7844 [Pristionchus entomophagus]